ncbi:unnamed protein product [Haemonchus placei]|uniref:protein-L-isoaspartate(D-aspartate) O-methyltransferase n=1 Tax=Haemonchus placei TaxID=6290 RepID=A0A0N4WSV6_HAEPC|nr:unnamed protein product [Haemonchus placei]
MRARENNSNPIALSRFECDRFVIARYAPRAMRNPVSSTIGSNVSLFLMSLVLSNYILQTLRQSLQIGDNGKVVGIEHIPELVELAKKNTRKNHADLLDSGRVLFVEGDGRRGYEMDHKYDAIHVGAAAETIPQPVTFLFYLLISNHINPRQCFSYFQVFLQVDKDENGEVTQKVIEHVIYVPLTSKNHQLGRD